MATSLAQKKLEEEAQALPRLGSGVATLAPPAPVMYAEGPRPVPDVAPAVAAEPVARGVTGLGLTPPSQLPAAAVAPVAAAAPTRMYARPATTVPTALPVEPGGPVYPRPGMAPATAEQIAARPASAALDPTAARLGGIYPRPSPTVYTPPAAAPAAPAVVTPQPVATTVTPEPRVPVGMGLGGARTTANPFVPATGASVPSAPAVAQLPGGDGAQPTSVAEGAMAAPVAGQVSRLGNSFSGTNVGLNAPGVPTAEQAAANGAANVAAINRDIAFQREKQTWADPNAPTPSVGSATVLSYGNDITDPTGRLQASRDFGDRAALDNAVRRNNGSRAGQAAVDAALQQVNSRARRGEVDAQVAGATQQTAMREAGDTSRLGLREAGDNRRADLVNARDTRRDTLQNQQEQLRNDIERQSFGLKAKAINLDNATKTRIEAVQTELMNATTPEAKKAASEKLAILSGRAVPNSFKAVTVGGGQVMDPTTNTLVTQPQSVVVVNEATGQAVDSGAGAPRAPATPAGWKSVGTIGGKPTYEDANGKRFVMQ